MQTGSLICAHTYEHQYNTNKMTEHIDKITIVIQILCTLWYYSLRERESQTMSSRMLVRDEHVWTEARPEVCGRSAGAPE